MSDIAMLVDARNAIYKAVYAIRSNQSTVKNHYFVAFLRQIRRWMKHISPTSVHVFWDAPRELVWRRKILESYKDRSSSNYVEGLAEDLTLTSNVAKEFFNNMGVYQYERDEMEADDLIYTAVSVLHPQPTIIVSSDSDMLQIPYRFTSSAILDVKTLENAEIPPVNPAYLKALTGDNSDRIDGYYGIGPKKAFDLLSSRKSLADFLALKGKEVFRRNLLLIDLSMCPKLLSNTFYVQKILSQPLAFNRQELNSLILKHKVQGLMQEFNELVVPFAKLVEDR